MTETVPPPTDAVTAAGCNDRPVADPKRVADLPADPHLAAKLLAKTCGCD